MRALSKADYGLFAFGVTLVSSLTILVSYGDTQSLGRFLAMYEEQGDQARFRGTLRFVLAKMAVTSLPIIGLVVMLSGWITATFVGQGDPAVLAIIVLLAPLEAVGAALGSLFAVFGQVGLVMIRRYIFAPTVRLLLVLWMLAAGYEARFLAVGYVAGELLGLVAYGALARRELGARGMLSGAGLSETRTYLRFAVPAGSVEFVNVVMATGTVLLLGHRHGAVAVADYRSVFPFARLNQMVLLTFTVLFTPMAARLFSRGDQEAMQAAHWRTSAYLMVVTFPLFVLSVPLASSSVPLLFGQRYVSADATLAVLGGAYFFHSAFGYNSLVLQTFGHVRWVLASNLVAVATTLGVAIVAIAPMGPVGAAWSLFAGLAAQNLTNQLGLRRLLGFRAFDPMVGKLLATCLAVASVFYWADRSGVPFAVLAVLNVAVTLGLARSFRSLIRLGEVFPELRKVPGLGRWLVL